MRQDFSVTEVLDYVITPGEGCPRRDLVGDIAPPVHCGGILGQWGLFVAKLEKTDLNEIIEMFDVELTLLSKLSKIEKMKMRSKIRREVHCLGVLRNPTPERILTRLEERIPGAFSVLPYGFSDKLRGLLQLTLARLQKKERQQRVRVQSAEPSGGVAPESTER